ncbi:nickel pincer cofactor biosynthesis protein LarB [candidate division KSB1 bacterium]
MTESDELKKLLDAFKKGEKTEEEVIAFLKRYSTETFDFAHIDHHRSLRKGFPEVIFCPGKTDEQIAAIIEAIRTRSGKFLATRATVENYEYAVKKIPGVIYKKEARIITTEETLKREEGQEAKIVIISAGTSDIPVAEEAAVTVEAFGSDVKRIYDVGIAGIHRLFKYVEDMQKALVIIVVAGMEGALSSVIGGLIDRPVIAVPTSVGYGASFNGLTALLGMLNSCASGVTVVNIDNGFGAGYAASLIVRSAEQV